MWVRTFSRVYPGIDKETIWKLWTDIEGWPAWHGDLDYCKLQGSFKVGNHFILKPKGMRPVKILLTEIEEGIKFTDCTIFFGAKMFDTHAMEDTKEGLRLINTLVVVGPLKWLWIKLVAKHVANTVMDETEALIKLAREMHG